MVPYHWKSALHGKRKMYFRIFRYKTETGIFPKDLFCRTIIIIILPHQIQYIIVYKINYSYITNKKSSVLHNWWPRQTRTLPSSVAIHSNFPNDANKWWPSTWIMLVPIQVRQQGCEFQESKHLDRVSTVTSDARQPSTTVGTAQSTNCSLLSTTRRHVDT